MKIDVKNVAKLANLKIKPEDEERLGKQLNEVLGYIEKLSEVNTNDVKITSQVTGLENVTRKDAVSPSLSQEEALSETPSKHNGMFKVSAIFENNE